jgi:hypothetical protein
MLILKILINSSTQTNSTENTSNKSDFENLDCIKFTLFVYLSPFLQNNYIIIIKAS